MNCEFYKQAGVKGRNLIIVFVAIFFAAAASISAAPGDLDLTFAGTGKVATNFLDHYDDAQAVAIQSDGKIVVMGTASSGTDVYERVGLVRYMPDGSLDVTFGIGGLVMSEFAAARDLAIQADGKIVVVGRTSAEDITSDFYVSRYNADGTLDVSFGVNGVVTTDFSGSFDGASGVALQTDGKIVVIGTTHILGEPTDFGMARYLSNGDLDPSFGAGGKVLIDFAGQSDIAQDIAIQADGRIVAVGRGDISDFGVARCESNGDLDPTFGIAGKVTTDFSGTLDEAFAVAIQADGKIVAGGRVGQNGGDTDFGLARYLQNGDLDPTFDVDGRVRTDFLTLNDRVNDIAIQPDGKILAAGLVTASLSQGIGDLDFGLTRYDSNGTLDGTFGTGGKVTTVIANNESATGIALQSDCKIVVAGFTDPGNTTDSMFGVARYDAGACSAPTACPMPQGYWKNNPTLWPVQSLIVGSKTYTKAELLALLNNSTKTDASVILAKQLIAAKLNIENGASAGPVETAVTNADSLLSGFAGKLPFKVKSSTVIGQNMVTKAGILDAYNNGALTPSCAP